MGKSLAILMITFAFCITAGFVSAGIPEINANDVLSVEPEEEFEVEVFVKCHAEEANYTVNVTLHPRFEFLEEGSDMNVSGNNASITYLGYDTDELRFEFPMMALNNTPEGDYNLNYQVYWNGSETGFVLTLVESDSVRVSVGEGGQDTCSSSSLIILPITAFVTMFFIVKKEKR